MSNKKVAWKLIKSALPAHITNNIDPRSLQLVDGAFIKNIKEELRTDIIYRAHLLSNSKRVLYVIMEHQSSIDYSIPLRLAEYHTCIIRRHWENHKKEKYPSVYKIVLYNGKKNYNLETEFFKKFQDPELAKEEFNRYYLVDLNKIDDAILKQDPVLGCVELVLKHGGSKKTLEFIREIGDVFKKSQTEDIDIVKICAQYLCEVSPEAISGYAVLYHFK